MTEKPLPPVPDGWAVVEPADRVLGEGNKVFATRFMPGVPREGEETAGIELVGEVEGWAA